MSLVCHECRRDIEYSTPLRFISKDNADQFTAVCIKCLGMLDSSTTKPITDSDHRLALHYGTSERNFNGSYSWSGMNLGDRIHYLNNNEVKNLLPRIWEMYGESCLPKLADEMKTHAEKYPLTMADMVSGKFPGYLRRHAIIQSEDYILQFSNDELSVDKKLLHLSFSRADQEIPNEEIQQIFRKAFFGESAHVATFPGNPVFGKHVIHMGLIK